MIQKFIKENNLSFEEGNRNSTVVPIIGYALHLGLTEEQLKEQLEKEITEDSFIEAEITRLFDYCKVRKYQDFWKTDDAKLKYKF